MKIIVTKNHNESCRLTADMIIDIIKNNSKPVLGLATGGTAENVYAEIIKTYNNKEISFKNVSTINLDEYVGLSPEHQQSYNYFMKHHLFNHVDISLENTFVPNGSNPTDAELKTFQQKLAAHPRDFQLLGVGPNGHIAFNEPAASLHANAHVVNIANTTIDANARYFNSKDEVPKQAFTQGMGDILKAKSIVLLATGSNKADAIKQLLCNDNITSEYPCTFLKTHPNTTIFIDEALAKEIGYHS